MLHVEALHDSRQQVGRDGRARPDAKRSLPEAAQRVQGVLGGALLGEDRAGVSEKHRACLGQADAGRHALHQPRPRLSLELVNALGHTGLGQSHLLRGAREALAVSDRHEDAEQSKAEWHDKNECRDD